MIGANLVAMGRIFIWYVVGLVVVSLCFVSPARAQQEYEFVAKWGIQGSGPGQFLAPFGIAVDSSTNVYVTDVGDGRVQKFTPAGQFIAQWSVSGPFVCPYGIAAGPSGNIYVADLCLIRIFKFGPTGQLLADWGTIGLGPGELICPAGISVDGLENIYVTDLCLDRVEKFNPAGAFIMEWGTSGHGPGEFNSAWSLAADGDGNVYVADTGNGRVQRFSSTGTFIAQWAGAPYFDPIGIAVDRVGDVYTANDVNALVEKFTPLGSLVARWGSFGSGDGQFTLPWGVAADGAGNVYVVDPNAWRVQKFRPLASAEFFLSLSTGDIQIGNVNEPLPIPLTVVVKDTQGQPKQGVTVDFSTSSKPAGATDQVVFPSGDTTDPSGLADTVLTLGNVPAAYQASADCPTCKPEAKTVTFNACGKLKNDDFKQFNTLWSGDHYDNICYLSTDTAKVVRNCQDPGLAGLSVSSFTISAKGCSMSAMATLINYYAEAFPALGVSLTTPAGLNLALGALGSDGFTSMGDIQWEAIEPISGKKLAPVGTVNISTSASASVRTAALASSADLDLLSAQPNPVIFRFQRKLGGGKPWSHFVLAVGKCGDKYVLADPGGVFPSLVDPNAVIVLDPPTRGTAGPLTGVRRFRRKIP